MNDYEKGWVSALIDSEGSLLWTREIPRINIVNTNFLLLVKARSLLGGSISYQNGKKLVVWTLQIAYKDWKFWLKDIPLIQKEIARQTMLKWQITHIHKHTAWRYSTDRKGWT